MQSELGQQGNRCQRQLQPLAVSTNCLDKALRGALATEGGGRHDESAEQADDESAEQSNDESAEQADESKHRPGQAVASLCTSWSHSRTFTFWIYTNF